MMVQSPAYELLSQLLRDPAFREIMQEAHKDYLPWSRLLEMRLPYGLSAVETWDTLQQLRKAVGVTIPYFAARDNPYWYAHTIRMDQLLAYLDRTCGSHSLPALEIETNTGRPVFRKLMMEEAVACAQLDGVKLAQADAIALLQRDAAPQSDLDRLLANTLRLFASLSEYATETFTPDLLRDFHRQLLSSVAYDALPRIAERQRVTFHNPDHERESASSSDERIWHICQVANNTSPTQEHAALIALRLDDIVSTSCILPSANALLGQVVFKLYAMKNGIPVLGMIPIVAEKLKWYSRVDKMNSAFLEWYRGDRRDLTVYYTLQLEFAYRAEEELTRRLAEAREQEAHLERILKDDLDLNYRQRLILGRALSNPDAEFRISHHRANHGITYVTARKDLVRLVEMGYFTSTSRGRATIFSPAAGMEGSILRHQGGAHGSGAPSNAESPPAQRDY